MQNFSILQDWNVYFSRINDTPTALRINLALIEVAPLFQNTPANQIAKLAPLLREAMNQHRVTGEQHNGLWLDVGTAERLQIANELAANWD